MKRKIKKITGDAIWIACYKTPLNRSRRMRSIGDAAWVWGFRDWYAHDQLSVDKSRESCDRFEKGGYAFRTEIAGNWANPTDGVNAALRGETSATREMVKFCREAAFDAEAYGDYDLARENREDADKLKRMEIEQRFENVERDDSE